MAVHHEIDSYSVNGYEATLQFDSGMEPGGETYVIISKDGERMITRTWYFDTFNEYHVRNFVEKFATDPEYREKCLNGERTWKKVQDAYREHNRDIWGVYSPVSEGKWGGAYDEAKDLAEKHCRKLFERFRELFDEVDDPTTSTIEEVKNSVREEAQGDAKDLESKYAPYPPEHEMTFGKYQGKQLLEVAREDPGYAEWAVEEMDNRPKVQGGFERALQKVEEASE